MTRATQTKTPTRPARAATRPRAALLSRAALSCVALTRAALTRAALTRIALSRAALARVALAALVAAAAAFVASERAARAADVADYRGRVAQAAVLLEELSSLLGRFGEDSSVTPAVVGATTTQTFTEVRTLLPAAERLEVRGARGSFEVSNRWLHDEFARFFQRPPDADEGARQMRSAAARLRAVAARLEEYEGAGLAARDKEAEKGRLAAILRKPEYAERGPSGGAVERLRERFAEWLRELFSKMGPIRPGSDPRATTAAQVIVYALAGGLIVFVGLRLWRRRGTWAQSPVPRDGARIVLGERLADDQSAADLLAEAERLARAGDLRAAIRRAYVALLVELGERRIVRLARHKTNRDYLQAVRERAAHLHGRVQPLTSDFERHWYGLEDATEEDWTRFRSGCRQALDGR